MTKYLKRLKHMTCVKALRSIGYVSVVVITLKFLSVVRYLACAKYFIRRTGITFINNIYLTHLKYTDAFNLIYLTYEILVMYMNYLMYNFYKNLLYANGRES